jgi:hypothetical protein
VVQMGYQQACSEVRQSISWEVNTWDAENEKGLILRIGLAPDRV